MKKRYQRYGLRLVVEECGVYECLKKQVLSSRFLCDAVLRIFGNDQSEEIFGLICLDSKNYISGVFEVSRGSLSSAVVHPREVFKRALLCNANSVAVFHFHPSGDPSPSGQDIALTKILIDSGDLLNIKLIDHIILAGVNGLSPDCGFAEYYSFKDHDRLYGCS